MECNREEALRAKEMAEQKFASQDYITAKKMAMKAQSLFPSLENIAQVIAVIDVHIAAQIRISAEDKDWYSILQVEPTADDTALKKQYKKLALWLHPDKNKATGAESAFKTIGEAFQVLSDKAKRKTFDSRRVLFYKKLSTKCAPVQNLKTYTTNGNPKQYRTTTKHHNVVNTPNHQGPDLLDKAKPQQAYVFNQQQPNVFNQQQSNTFNKSFQQQPNVFHQQHPNIINNQSFAYDKSMQHDASWCSQTQAGNAQHPQFHPFTFWTLCSSCHMRYQYFRKYENQNLLCPQCMKPFIAKDISSSLSQRNSTKSWFSQTCQSMYNYSVNVGDSAAFRFPNVSVNEFKPNSIPSFSRSANQSNIPVTSSIASKASRAFTNPVKGEMLDELHMGNVGDTAKTLAKENDDVGKKVDEYLKAMLMQENGNGVAEKLDELRKEHLTKGGVFKTFEEYFKSIENQKEQIFKGKTSNLEEFLKKFEEYQRSMQNEAHDLSNSTDNVAPKPAEKDEVARNFQKYNCSYLRTAQSEEVAKKVELYQKLVMDMGVKRQNNQVEKSKAASSTSSDMKKKNDQVDKSKDVNSASSDMKKENCQLDKPKDVNSASSDMGKEQAAKLSANAKKKRGRKKKYSSSSESKDNNNESWKKSTSDAKIENLKTYPRRSSQSKQKVNYNCIESDDDFQDGPPSKKARAESTGTVCTKTNSVETKKLSDLAKNAIRMGLNKHKSCENADRSSLHMIQNCGPIESKIQHCTEKKPDGDKGQFDCTIPDAEFHNFDEGREEKDVQVGQVWALYDDKDGMPKYYMKVKDIKSRSPFKVSITWYELWKPFDELDELIEADFSFGCGFFKPSSIQVMTNVNSFSHLVNWEKCSKGIIKIYPKKGEIWAIYQQWKQDQRVVKLCDMPFMYDMVEVLADCNEATGVSVMPLQKVQGFKTLYCLSNREAIKIPFSEVMRFSHQVPAYKLKGEESPGIPDCSWELDPAAIPLS